MVCNYFGLVFLLALGFPHGVGFVEEFEVVGVEGGVVVVGHFLDDGAEDLVFLENFFLGLGEAGGDVAGVESVAVEAVAGAGAFVEDWGDGSLSEGVLVGGVVAWG